MICKKNSSHWLAFLIQGGSLLSQTNFSCDIKLWIILSSVLVKYQTFTSILMLDRAFIQSNSLIALPISSRSAFL